MRIFDHEPRSVRPLPWLLLAFVVVVMAAGGFGFLERGFLQRLKADPEDTLIRRPLRILQARHDAADLPLLHVDMKFKHYEKILARRQEALERGVLQTADDDLVPAEIELDGHRVRVKMRLKGDWPDHFETEKWSYRVQVRGDDQLFGMRRFSLQHPASRRFLSEWAFLEHMRREGILSPRYQFVRLVFNGDDKGIFALEEHFAKELLESQGRRDGPILKLDEAPLWEARGRALDTELLNYSVFDQLDYRSARVDFFGENRLRADSLLWSQAQVARRRLEAWQRGEARASEVFDLEAMARYLAICRLWGANHALIWHNLRFYYDPVSTLLEPIPFDGEPIEWHREEMWATDLMGGYEVVTGHGGWFRWIEDALADETLRHRYLEELYRVSRIEHVRSYESAVRDAARDYARALRVEWLDLADPFTALELGRAYIAGRFEPAQSVVVIATQRSDAAAIHLRLSNVAQLPCVLRELRAPDGHILWQGELELPGRTRREGLVRRNLEVVLAGEAMPSELVLLSSMGGVAPVREDRFQVRPVNVVAEGVAPPTNDLELLKRQHPYLRRSGSREWTIEAGTHEVALDLSLPEGWSLRLEAGAELLFAESSVLVCRGPLYCDGTAAQPVRLAPLYNSWPGLLVLNSEERSQLSHVEFLATRGVDRPGWTLLGGVNFQESPVEFQHCRFIGHQGEDALNLIRCRFEMRDCRFEESNSDAFDGDFIDGTILRVKMQDIGGDALDLSGSRVRVEGMQAIRIKDKAVSAGESTQLELRDLHVRSAAIGIASKDLSTVIVESARFEQLEIGLAAYTKKSVYGPGFLDARNCVMIGVAREVLVQQGSEVRWNLQLFEGSDLDVKELYRRGILGSQP